MISLSDFSANAITVRQLNLYVKSLLEGDKRLVSCIVVGEVSNFKRHFSSGHCYFTLKDEFAAVKCVMFKGSALGLNFNITDGMKLILRGKVSLYEKDGSYQFYVDYAEPEGIGAKALALKQLKEKLAAEGFFNQETKRAIVKYPKKIAVVTSSLGAALQDILNIISRRYPLCELVVAGASVQGVNAVNEIVNALEKVYQLDGVDTVIIGRGGGSNEDLDAFNSELLARKIYQSPFPVISAVGHETDITICDLVADLRAPTPSAAAELAVPDITQITRKIELLNGNIYNLCQAKIDLCYSKLKSLSPLFSLEKFNFFIENNALSLDLLSERISHLYKNNVNSFAIKFGELTARIEALNPLKILSRGYGVVLKENKAVTTVKNITNGDMLNIKLSDGEIDCTVIDRR